MVLGREALRRFWFPLPTNFGIGVTAWTLAEARTLAEEARRRFFPNAPEPAEVVEDVDIRALDQKHVVPNMGPVALHGVWFPRQNV